MSFRKILDSLSDEEIEAALNGMEKKIQEQEQVAPALPSTIQHVPVIAQRDAAIEKAGELHAEVERLKGEKAAWQEDANYNLSIVADMGHEIESLKKLLRRWANSKANEWVTQYDKDIMYDTHKALE